MSDQYHPSDSPAYTHGHHESVLRSHRWRTAENSAAYLLPQLTTGMTVLDVGAGPGTITADLADVVAPGRVLALEPTEAGLDLARAEARRQGVDNVDFAVGDVLALDQGDDSFDVVHAHQVLQHVSDPVGALSEMARVCRPDGLVAARDADYAAFSWYPLIPGLDDWLSLYRKVARANGGEPDAGRRLIAWGREAGLSGIRPSASIWCYSAGLRPAVVGRELGGAGAGVRPGPSRARPRARDPRRSAGPVDGVARVVAQRRRLVHGAARRDPRGARTVTRGCPVREPATAHHRREDVSCDTKRPLDGGKRCAALRRGVRLRAASRPGPRAW